MKAYYISGKQPDMIEMVENPMGDWVSIGEFLGEARSPENVQAVTKIITDRLFQEEHLDAVKAANEIVKFLTTPRLVEPSDETP